MKAKKAFSLFELALVLLMLGILLNSMSVFKPEDQILSGAWHIMNDLRYTRELALRQESMRPEDFKVATRQWYKARWQLYFIRSKSATNNEQTYTIFLDKNGDGNANIGKSDKNVDREIAVDFLSPKRLMNAGQSGVISANDEKANPRFNIQKKFGIVGVSFRAACAGSTRVIFDEFGRLHGPLKSAKSEEANLLYKKGPTCVIRLLSKTRAVCLAIDTMSGLVSLPPISRGRQILRINNREKECRDL